MKTIRTTTALCRDCHESHPAEVVIRDGAVFGITHCPDGDQEVLISSNPELYQILSDRTKILPEQPPPTGLKSVLNYLSITNACNFHCTVCGTNAGGPDKHTYLSVEEICARAKRARDEGANVLHLFGGEPTLHKQLLEILRRLTDMGLSIGLVTNGYRLGRDPEYASILKEHGCKRVCLQFDSLQQTSLCLLSRDYLEEKQNAIRHVIEAGLDLGLNCTVTQQTLPELTSLLEHGISLGERVRNMTFGCAAPVGRFLIPEGHTVDREQIVSGLTEGEGNPYFRLEDVQPLPTYLPWGLQVHPDCGVHILMLRDRKGAKPLNAFVNLSRFYERLSKVPASRTVFAMRVKPLLYLLGSVRWKKLPGFLRWAGGFALKRKGFGFLNLGITDYRAAEFLDEQRLCRCASAFHTSAGPIRSCLHFYQRQDLPGSLEYEAAHQSC